MYCKDGKVLDIRETDDVDFTFSNIIRDDWEIVKESFNFGEKMNFGEALEQVKQGRGMRLPQWKEDVVIRAQFPDEHSKMTAPYLYMESRFERVPWKETMIELFSEDWQVVE